MRAILHADRNWGIGKNNDLMFSIPKDMKFFRTTTSGKVVVMGSHTLDSFPGGRPLKNRTNIVLSSSMPEERAKENGFVLVRSFEDLLAEIKKYNPEDVFVIGGAKLYKALLPYCSEALVTKVDADGGAEVFFENLDALASWSLVSQSPWEDDNGYQISFCSYENKDVKTI